MALYKAIIASNGVPVSYHRIALITIDVNNQNTVLVHSYVSDDGRQIEKDHAAGIIEMNETNRPYVDAQYLNCDYDGSMTLEKAYEWLKTLPQYEGAEDC